MKKVQLTSICKPKQWKTIPTSELMKEGYPVYGANGIIGYYNEYNHGDRTIAITCRGATCGTVNMTVPKSYITGNAMCLDEVSDEIDIDYLFYVMQAYDFKKVISGTAQPQITREGLSKVEVVVYPKDKQTEVVKRIGIIESAIANAKTRIALLDDLVKSRFVEMFGDPIRNPRGWEVTTIGDIVTDVRYGTSKPAVEGGKYPYLRMNNLTFDGRLDLTDLKYIDIPDEELEKCVVRKGDVLFNRTNSVELVGKTATFDFNQEMVIAGYIIRVRLNERMLPEVLSQYMNLEALKTLLRDMAKGAVNQANINAQELQSIKVYVPDIDSQKRFVDIKAQTDKSKLAVQKELEKLEILKKSLMQQYFG